MLGSAINILLDERGSAFIENALWIALFVLVVASAVGSLAATTKNALNNQVEKIKAD